MTVSLFLILLTFFILLNSIAVLDENRIRVALGSLIGAFGGLPGGLSPLDTGETVLPPSAPMIDAELTLDQLLGRMNKNFFVGEIKIKTIKEGTMITIKKEVLLNHKQMINPALFPFLERLSGLINRGNYQVEIAGHTDNTTPREKGYQSNWELSALTAMRVLKYFVTKGEVSPERLTAYGCSSYVPIASNDTRLLRSQNGRVEIILNYNTPAYIKRIFKKRPSGFFTYRKFDFKIF